MMTSSDLLSYGFVSWYPFTLDNEKTLLKLLPARPGVYAMRCRKPSDIAGSSDIVYFGKAANQAGLKQRIRQYYHPGNANRTSLRIRALLTDCADFEISVVETAVDAARHLESKLIGKYKAAHKNRPPWNKCD
jgi:excinuclease UvrABC nuclease subunit